MKRILVVLMMLGAFACEAQSSHCSYEKSITKTQATKVWEFNYEFSDEQPQLIGEFGDLCSLEYYWDRKTDSTGCITWSQWATLLVSYDDALIFWDLLDRFEQGHISYEFFSNTLKNTFVVVEFGEYYMLHNKNHK